MRCPNCSAQAPDNVRFCPQCGMPMQHPVVTGPQSARPTGGCGPFFIALTLSLLISIVLSAVFGFPIFILGAILPLFWLGRRR